MLIIKYYKYERKSLKVSGRIICFITVSALSAAAIRILLLAGLQLLWVSTRWQHHCRWKWNMEELAGFLSHWNNLMGAWAHASVCGGEQRSCVCECACIVHIHTPTESGKAGRRPPAAPGFGSSTSTFSPMLSGCPFKFHKVGKNKNKKQQYANHQFTIGQSCARFQGEGGAVSLSEALYTDHKKHWPLKSICSFRMWKWSWALPKKRWLSDQGKDICAVFRPQFLFHNTCTLNTLHF